MSYAETLLPEFDQGLGGFAPLPDVQDAPPVGVPAPFVVTGLVTNPGGSAVD